MVKLSSRLKKAFNQYDTKDAVLDYVNSLSNPRDLLSGDLKIFEDVKQDRLVVWYKSLLETSQRLENNNYVNAAAKRDDCDEALDTLQDIYFLLKYRIKEYDPVSYFSRDDSFLELRQSKYKLSEKEAIKAYYDSLEDPKDLLSGKIGDKIHWKGNENLLNTYFDYLSMEASADQHPLVFVSLEEHAEESVKFAQCKIQCYDMIRTQLEKFYPDIAALYDKHINPEVFDVNSVALGMEKYVETLTNKSDITSGSHFYLPEYIKSYCDTLSGATFGVSEFLTEDEFHTIEKQVLNDAYDHYKALNSKDVVQEPEPSYSKSNSESLNIENQKQNTTNNEQPHENMEEYLKSLSKPGDYLSGNPELLPKDLKEKHLQFAALEEAYFTGERFVRKNDEAPYTEALKDARKDYYSSLITACETYLNNKELNNQQNSDMKDNQTVKTEVKEKREPQLVTDNGDKITHGHAFKSNKSEDWFFTAKINGVPMKAQLMDPRDTEKFLVEKSVTAQDMIKKYYPAVLLPKVNVAEFKLPRAITTANGEEQLIRFNVYKENNPESQDYGKYRLYAQVGDKKMSCNASKQDLDAYFNRVTTPVQLVMKNFGDKLGMAAHYEQFKLPEGMNIEGKNILLRKNQETNRYEISVKTSDGIQTPSKELSYDDRQSYFQHKVVSKEQLAAKYLSNELVALSKVQKPKTEKQMSLGM